MTNADPKILIGQDNWPLLETRRTIYGPWNGPVLSKTLLGWVIHANCDIKLCKEIKHFVNFIDLKLKDDLDLLHDFVKYQYGNKKRLIAKLTINSKEDIRAQENLDRILKRIGDKF